MSDNVLTEIEISQMKIKEIQRRLKELLNKVNYKYGKEIKYYEKNNTFNQI